jgi:hypothetical protein
MDPMNCDKCGQPVQESLCRCHSCGNDIGFPNVRAANSTEEQAALSERVRGAYGRASERGCADQLREFHSHAARSSAVVAMSARKARNLLSDASELHASYHKRLSAGTTLPKANRFDQIREATDAKLFPNYFREMTFAALALDGRGSCYYGSVSLEIKAIAIDARATVFESNSLLFMDHLPQSDPIPPGKRAGWDRRHDLAVAKLEPRIDVLSSIAAYPQLLLSQNPSDDADFVEVHIYGSLHRSAVARVAMADPSDAIDEIDQMAIRDLCRKLLIECGGNE